VKAVLQIFIACLAMKMRRNEKMDLKIRQNTEYTKQLQVLHWKEIK